MRQFMARIHVGSAGQRYTLELYVSGASERSRRAIANLNSVCEQYLTGEYDLEVIDIYQAPLRAKDADILAAPTLIRQLPLPRRRIIGDLSERGRVLMLLDIKKKAGPNGQTATTRRNEKRG
jgi:circadian clock protein KaiB